MSGQLFRFEVRRPGRPMDLVEADSIDIIAWERLGQGRHFGRLEKELRMSDLAEVAWFALRRLAGGTDGDNTGADDLPSRPEFVRTVPVKPVDPADSDEDDEGEPLDELLDPTQPTR
jgi:hypothetical protein